MGHPLLKSKAAPGRVPIKAKTEDSHETRQQSCHHFRRRIRHGRSPARMFACEGANVVIADVLEDEGRQVAEGIGASACFEGLDVTR